MTLYTAKMTETIYATAIGVAVHPLRAVAMDNAEARARATVAKTREELEAAGWDITAAAPYPDYHRTKGWTEFEKNLAKARYVRFHALAKTDPAKGYQLNNGREPHFVIMSDAGIERFISEARDMAAAQYDAFAAKLINKIGEHATAVLEGNHVWGESFLTVTFAGDKPKETWKTQQIWNVSKLGKDFPQWPSRKQKVAR